MTLVRGRGRPRREYPSVAPSDAPSIAPLDSSPSPKSGDKLSNQPARPSGRKPLTNPPLTTNSIPKYSEDDLQKIFKAVLEARAPISAPAPVLAPAPILAPAAVLAPAPAPVFASAPIIAETYREKLKACFPGLYRGKSHMDYYNSCQQCEDYFATAGATGPTRIPFAASFLRDRISFRWQQYKWRHDAETPVPVTWDKFKAFFWQSLSDSQASVDTY